MIRADELRQALKREIVGQDRAADAAARAVIIAELGISDPTHPLGTFLFLGPTGTGKSQLARSLAKVPHGSERDSIAINCTAFKNPHDVAKLTGAPLGHIGHDRPPSSPPRSWRKDSRCSSSRSWRRPTARRSTCCSRCWSAASLRPAAASTWTSRAASSS